MAIFKTVAVSTSIICASLFFGDVEAFNERAFNNIVMLNEIKQKAQHTIDDKMSNYNYRIALELLTNSIKLILKL